MKCKHEAYGTDLFVQHRADGEVYDATLTYEAQGGGPISWRCARCGEYASLGDARDDGEHAAAVAIEVRAAELAAAWEPEGGIKIAFTESERIGWMLWPHVAPKSPEGEAGWLASQIQNHRMDGHNIAGAEYAAKLVATTHDTEQEGTK